MDKLVELQNLDVFLSYESFEKALVENEWDPQLKILLKIQYKILFRRWDLIEENEVDDASLEMAWRPEDNGKKIRWIKTDITINQLIEINKGYYNKAFQSFSVDGVGELGYYTDPIINNRSVIDIFFMGVFPMLNIKEFPVQTRASKKLKSAPFHLVFDEVGTGKTVTALYCIREELLKNNSSSKILILCPNNKKNEWIKDIQRQLGLYSHEVPNSADDVVYCGDLKAIYFKEGEPCIFVEGQKKSEKKDALDTWKDKELWDLVVIDECHLCFDNYEKIKSQKVLFLTATPIVINSHSQDGFLDIRKERTIQDYIDLAKKITDCHENIQIDNLFSENAYFTQLFREDLGINPKQRKIIFKHTDRLENRDEYLDALRTAVGGMSRLIYEQDDEFLMHGVFHKFRKKLEDSGFCIPDEPEDTENNKYNALCEVIAEKDANNYIVFFNSKWPAENVYNKLINDLNSCGNHVVVALKFGKTQCKVWPRDNTVNSDNFFDYLFSKIESGIKVIFLTTGATGGTGLNLGKFDGIINYEMPFTCIELEQRFGRVDRMDVAIGQDREMIFFLNNDYNPMLRYCLLKINRTCLHMPIRNTILFCPQVIQEVSNDLANEYKSYKLTEKDLKFVARKNTLPDEERQIAERFEQCVIKRNSNKFEEDISELSEDCVEIMEYIRANDDIIRKLNIKCKGLANIENELSNWLHIIGIESGEAATMEIGSVLVASDEENDDYIDESTIDMTNQVIMGNLVIEENDSNKYPFDCKRIEQMLSVLCSSKVEEQMASGVFYIDNGYHRETVAQFRSKCPIEVR